jgi:hypothetical protein
MSGALGISLSQTGQALQPTIGGGADAALSRASTPQPTTPPAEETRVVVVGLGACGGSLALDAASLAACGWLQERRWMMSHEQDNQYQNNNIMVDTPNAGSRSWVFSLLVVRWEYLIATYTRFFHLACTPLTLRRILK